jgi:hypothetical protein
MKTFSKIGIFFLIISGFLAYAAPVLAATPYLSITSLGNNLAQISISNANPYSPISLYESQQGSNSWTVINNLGNTDGSGSFNQQTGLGANLSGTSMSAYVVVGGVPSNTVTISPGGPCVYSGYGYNYNNCGCGANSYNCGGGLSLSQTSVSLVVGQTVSVSVQNSSGSIYISNNSNQSVVSATASYNSVSLYGLNAGSSTLTICGSGYSQCATLFVTVTGNGTGNGSVTFSQSSLNLALNQNITVYVYGTNGYNLFYLSNNSSNNTVIASLSGNVLSLTGYNAGSATLTVCQSSGGGCGSLYVTVGGGYNNGGVTFSQNNLVLTAGQTSTVYIYGYSGYYISSNSNGSVASAAVNGSVLTITALASGNTIFTVCQNNNNTCGSLSVAVSGNNCSYGYNCGSGNVSFSQNNISLSSGQSQTVTVYGNAPFTISSNSNSGVISASVSGNIITLYGYSSGSSSILVCSNTYGGSAYGGCGTLYVTVNGYNNNCGYPYNNNCGGTVSLSQTSVSVAVGQTVSVSVYGTGPFYLSSNGSSNIASGVMSGNTLNIYGSQPGAATITVCQQNYSSNCGSVYITVSGNGCTYNCGSVLGSSIYANGQLLNIGGTVYIVYQNTLTAFSSASVFLGLGYSFGNVINVSYQSGLTISSYVISTTAGAHPWGSWVKNGAAVYFVSQQGLIPVPDWNTFSNNGGSASLIVPANAWDFQLPLLPPMTYNDSRVR